MRRALLVRLGLGAGLGLALVGCGGETGDASKDQQSGPSFKLVPQLAAVEDTAAPAAIGPETESGAGIPTLSPDAFAQAIRDKDVRLIDVRTPGEYAQGHITGAQLIPLDQFDPAAIDLGEAGQVILYCRSDHRSGIAAARWATARAEPVAHLEGGILAWEAQGLPVTRP